MTREFRLPDLGEGLHEAEIVKVLVREGDEVQEDAPLLEVETDKAQVEIPSPVSGRVEKVHVAPGQVVRVGQVLVTFGDGGRPPASGAEPAAEAGRDREAVAVRRDVAAGPVPATPATRRLARELGVDLRVVTGTGPGGRVTDDDVRRAADARRAAPATGAPPAPGEARPAGAERRPLRTVVEAPPLPDFAQWGPVERRPLSHLRRTIAERMTLSASVIPHVTHFDEADITELQALIARNLAAAQAQGVTLTLTAFLLKAAALALREHPQFNASLDAAGGELIVKRYYHLGVAVATERGLVVPVIRDVDRKPLLALQRELGALAERVRAGRATLEDLRGGTFTVTNIGALGGTGAIPIINYPEVAILGAARAREVPVVRDGAVVPRLILPLTLTFDHRVADGADGARFARDIVRRLERPDTLLLEL
jgi:pyruvate dehydrogenase E2 component (dihydrolipoamide acetyltransferase)